MRHPRRQNSQVMPTQLARILAAAFALLVAAAGWHYTFYSVAASNLSGIEDVRLNRRRVRLRRFNGVIMMLLAVGLCAGVFTFDETTPQEFLLVWFGVIVLMALTITLTLIDVRLTWRLARRRRQRGEERDDAAGGHAGGGKGSST